MSSEDLRTQSECSQVVLARASPQLSWGSADLLSQRDWGTVSGVQSGARVEADVRNIIVKLNIISHHFFLKVIFKDRFFSHDHP